MSLNFSRLRSFQFKSVRTRLLVWFSLLGVIPMVIVGWMAYTRTRDTLVENYGHELQMLAEETADKVDRNLFERYGDVQAFAENPHARGSAADATTAANFYMKCYGLYDLMIVADANGKVLAVNTIDYNGEPINSGKLVGRSVQGEAWFQAVVGGKVKKGKPTTARRRMTRW